MKFCVLTSDINAYATQALFLEGRKLGHSVSVFQWSDVTISTLEKTTSIQIGGEDARSFDAIIPRNSAFIKKTSEGSRRATYSHLIPLLVSFCRKHGGFYLNSNYFAHFHEDNKLAQQVFFQEVGLPGIESLGLSPDNPYFSQIAPPIPFPHVLKKLSGSHGSGVFLAKNSAEEQSLLHEHFETESSFLLQRYIPLETDFRVLVLGSEALGVMARSAGSDWRTNISSGGKPSAITETDRKRLFEELALRATRSLELDFAGVDILEDGKELLVIECNSLPQFEGFDSVFPDLNTAKQLIKYAEKSILDRQRYV